MPIPCQLLGVWLVGPFPRTALSQGEKAALTCSQVLRTPGPPRSELLGSRRALLRPQDSLLSSAHASPSELVPTDRAQSELVCLPSPAVTSAAKNGSVRSAEESYQLNPKDTLQ